MAAAKKVLKCKGRYQNGRLMPGYKLVKGGVVKVNGRKAAPKAATAPKRRKRRATGATGAATFQTPFVPGVEAVRFRPLKRRTVADAIRYDFSGRGPGVDRRWSGIAGLLEYKPAAPSRRRSGGIGGQLSLFG